MFFTFLFYWIERKKTSFFLEKVWESFAELKKNTTFAPQSREKATIKTKKLNGALVQLVRIHACHAWGHGFESRTHRNKY